MCQWLVNRVVMETRGREVIVIWILVVSEGCVSRAEQFIEILRYDQVQYPNELQFFC